MTTRFDRKLACALGRLKIDTSGLAIIELALMSPILIVGGMTGLEFTNYVLASQKVERLAATSADMFARNQIAPNEGQVRDIFKAINLVGAPFNLKANGRVIVTGVIGILDTTESPVDVENRIAWQRCSGDLEGQTSTMGAQWSGADYADGPEVVLPNGIDLAQTEMAIVAEVWYRYQPMVNYRLIPGFATNRVFKQRSVFRTRGKAYTSITPLAGTTAATCA